MVDNFEQIKKLLKFTSDDDFYFVQVIQRKKDNPDIVKGSNNNNRLIKAYYIRSIEHLDKYKDEMITLANLFNARVGINLNKRSFGRVTLTTLNKIVNQMMNGDYLNTHKAYNSACGIHNDREDRIWLLDIDSKEVSPIMLAFIEHECQPIIDSTLFPRPSKILAIIPSNSGYHVITKAFDTREFAQRYPEVEIHKNNPVNLYIP
jgi:hypothetical protein